MPVESEQAQAPGQVTTQPPESEPGARGPRAPEAPEAPTRERPVAAPRPPHDQHELPDGRYLIAYRSAPDA